MSEAERSIQVGEEARLQIGRCGMFQGWGRVWESRVAGWWQRWWGDYENTLFKNSRMASNKYLLVNLKIKSR